MTSTRNPNITYATPPIRRVAEPFADFSADVSDSYDSDCDWQAIGTQTVGVVDSGNGSSSRTHTLSQLITLDISGKLRQEALKAVALAAQPLYQFLEVYSAMVGGLEDNGPTMEDLVHVFPYDIEEQATKPSPLSTTTLSPPDFTSTISTQDVEPGVEFLQELSSTFGLATIQSDPNFLTAVRSVLTMRKNTYQKQLNDLETQQQLPPTPPPRQTGRPGLTTPKTQTAEKKAETLELKIQLENWIASMDKIIAEVSRGISTTSTSPHRQAQLMFRPGHYFGFLMLRPAMRGLIIAGTSDINQFAGKDFEATELMYSSAVAPQFAKFLASLRRQYARFGRIQRGLGGGTTVIYTGRSRYQIAQSKTDRAAALAYWSKVVRGPAGELKLLRTAPQRSYGSTRMYRSHTHANISLPPAIPLRLRST